MLISFLKYNREIEKVSILLFLPLFLFLFAIVLYTHSLHHANFYIERGEGREKKARINIYLFETYFDIYLFRLENAPLCSDFFLFKFIPIQSD